MNYANPVFTINNASTTSTPAFDCSFVLFLSAQAAFTDAAGAGSLKFEASNDPGPAAPTHWSTIGTPATVASGALTLLPGMAVCYRWVRATFVSSGGAGTISIAFHSQGE